MAIVLTGLIAMDGVMPMDDSKTKVAIWWRWMVVMHYIDER